MVCCESPIIQEMQKKQTDKCIDLEDRKRVDANVDAKVDMHEVPDARERNYVSDSSCR